MGVRNILSFFYGKVACGWDCQREGHWRPQLLSDSQDLVHLVRVDFWECSRELVDLQAVFNANPVCNVLDGQV
jgi:hypothetical protein